MERSEVRVGPPGLRVASRRFIRTTGYRPATGLRPGERALRSQERQSPGRGTRPALFCWAALGVTGGPPSECPIPNPTWPWLLWLVLSHGSSPEVESAIRPVLWVARRSFHPTDLTRGSLHG